MITYIKINKMNEDYFENMTYCEFVIISKEITPQQITNEFGIEPTRYFNKGDLISSKHSNEVGFKPWHLWAIKSLPIIKIEESISAHIEHIKSHLLPILPKLKGYKDNPLYEMSFLVRIETEDGGIGFDINEEELSFINSISNRLHFSFLAKDNIDL